MCQASLLKRLNRVNPWTASNTLWADRKRVLLHICHERGVKVSSTQYPSEMQIRFQNGRTGYVCMNARFLTIAILPNSVTITSSDADFTSKFEALCKINTMVRRRHHDNMFMHADSMHFNSFMRIFPRH